MITVNVDFFDTERTTDTQTFSNSLSTVNYLNSLANTEPINVLATGENVSLFWDFDGVVIEAHVHGTTIDRMLAAFESGECTKCEGEGYIPVYKHVKNGICFRCKGTGIDPKN